MSDLICDRFCASDIRARYTALDEVSSSLRRFQQDSIRDLRSNCDAGILEVGEAHHPSLDAFVEYMREAYNRLEASILESCYGTENKPTDGEPYWRVRAYYTITWTAGDPDGGTYIESDSPMDGEWYFRTEQDAMEWGKYLAAKDPELDIDDPRFFGDADSMDLYRNWWEG